jgi:hypothetical protein
MINGIAWITSGWAKDKQVIINLDRSSATIGGALVKCVSAMHLATKSCDDGVDGNVNESKCAVATTRCATIGSKWGQIIAKKRQFRRHAIEPSSANSAR